jgi:hypothetical protein
MTDELKRLAKKASSGPWKAYNRGVGFDVLDGTGDAINWKGTKDGTMTAEDAAYIAAANPQAILALIAERDAWKKYAEELAEFADPYDLGMITKPPEAT